MRKLTDEQIEQVVMRASAGENQGKIAQDYGICQASVSLHLVKSRINKSNSCECGCGEKVRARFLTGHNRRTDKCGRGLHLLEDGNIYVRDGKRVCKTCHLEGQKRRRRNNPIHHRKLAIKNRYGISYEEVEALLRIQNNQCGICHIDFKEHDDRMAIDHCHVTGRVRGLLCRKCNSAIGLLGDSVERLSEALQYLLSCSQ